MSVRLISNVTKEYPDMFKVIIYHEPFYLADPANRIKRVKEIVDEDHYKPMISSVRRTKGLIKDIISCNNFDYFCTFTFDPKKIDSYNFHQCLYCVTKFMSRQKDCDYHFAYLLVPEQHKSGRWHFHALIKHFNGHLRPSGHYSNTGRPVFNITSFRSGFSTAVEIDDKEAVGEYVSKYITKDFVTNFNRRRFYCSRNLVRPVKVVNSPIFRNTPPLFRQLVHAGQDSDQYVIDKTGLV